MNRSKPASTLAFTPSCFNLTGHYWGVIGNYNSRAPSRQEHLKAMERATREQTLAEQLGKVREAEIRGATTTTLTQVKVSPNPAAQKPNRPDRYYDRPDRYNNRTSSSSTTIQSQ